MRRWQFFSAAGGAPATVTFTDSSVDATNGTVYTFSGQAIGTAASNRKVVFAAYASNGPANATATLGGNAATQIASVTNGGGEIRLFQIDVPSGTTADIVVTWSAGVLRCGIGVWAVYGAESSAHATAADSDGSDPLSVSLNCPAGGVVIAAAFNSNGSTFTWAGVTENYDEVVEGANTHTGASDAFATTQTGLAISCDPSASSDQGLVAASWGPA